MGLFTSTLKSELAKATKKPGTVEDAAHVQTGFDFIDAYGGVIARGKDGEDIYHFGLPMGKIILAVGNSQGGKTTLAQQIANNMAEQLDGDVLHYDCENASVNHEGRVCNICSIDEETYTAIWTLLKGASLTTEEFKKLIFRIKEFKQKLKAKDMVEWTNLKGETIRIYPPTIVILDSIPALKPKEVIESQELDNNMVAGKMAAANGNLLTSISSLLEEFNITIIAV